MLKISLVSEFKMVEVGQSQFGRLMKRPLQGLTSEVRVVWEEWQQKKGER